MQLYYLHANRNMALLFARPRILMRDPDLKSNSNAEGSVYATVLQKPF